MITIKQGEGEWQEQARATRCLQETHGELRRHDLGPWKMIPWREMAKLLGCGGSAPSCVVIVYVVGGDFVTSGEIAHTSVRYKFRGTVCPLIPFFISMMGGGVH